ncbi:MAG: ABC transporter substrate-binding protein [Lawsonibacter sp.]
MKKITALLLSAAMSLALVSCGSTASSGGSSSSAPSGSGSGSASGALPYAGQTLVVQVWGGTYEETLRNYVIPSFEEKTGATVEVVSGAAPLSQLATEGDNASIDVLHVDTFEVVQGTNMGVLEPLDVSKLENAPDLYDEAFMYDTAVVTNWGTYGIVYRADLVKSEPTSWLDLWDPAYADGKIGMIDYSMGGGLEFLEAISRIQGTHIEDTANWDNLFDKLQSLKGNIGIYASQHADLESALSSGDIVASVETNGRAIGLMKEGYDVKFCQPKEGSIAMTSLAAISSGSTKKDLAYLFVNELLSPEAQKAYAENNYYAPSNSKTVIDAELQGYMPYGQEQVSNLAYMDSAALENVKADLIDRWNRDFK